MHQRAYQAPACRFQQNIGALAGRNHHSLLLNSMFLDAGVRREHRAARKQRRRMRVFIQYARTFSVESVLSTDDGRSTDDDDDEDEVPAVKLPELSGAEISSSVATSEGETAQSIE